MLHQPTNRDLSKTYSDGIFQFVCRISYDSRSTWHGGHRVTCNSATDHSNFGCKRWGPTIWKQSVSLHTHIGFQEFFNSGVCQGMQERKIFFKLRKYIHKVASSLISLVWAQLQTLLYQEAGVCGFYLVTPIFIKNVISTLFEWLNDWIVNWMSV